MKPDINKALKKFFLLSVCIYISACGASTPKVDSTPAIDQGSINRPSTDINKTETIAATHELNTEYLPDDSLPVLHIHHMGDLTSRNAAYSTPAIHGLEDWAKEINQNPEHYQLRVNLSFTEIGDNESLAVSEFEKILDTEKVLVMVVYQTNIAEALLPVAAANQVPILNLGYDPIENPTENATYIFNFFVPYDQQFAFFIEQLVGAWELYNPVTLDTGIRLAYFAWDDPFGHAALTDENLALLKNLNVDLVMEKYFFRSPVELLSNAILSAWDRGANVIYTNTYLHGPSLIMNELNRLALQDFYVIAGPSASMDIYSYSFIEYNRYLNGYIAPFASAWFGDSDLSALERIESNFTANQRIAPDRASQRILAQGVLEMLAELGLEMMKHQEAKDLNSAMFYEAIASLDDYEVLGGIFKLDFSGGNRNLSELHLRRVTDFLTFTKIEN